MRKALYKLAILNSLVLGVPKAFAAPGDAGRWSAIIEVEGYSSNTINNSYNTMPTSSYEDGPYAETQTLAAEYKEENGIADKAKQNSSSIDQTSKHQEEHEKNLQKNYKTELKAAESKPGKEEVTDNFFKKLFEKAKSATIGNPLIANPAPAPDAKHNPTTKEVSDQNQPSEVVKIGGIGKVEVKQPQANPDAKHNPTTKEVSEQPPIARW